MTTTAMPVHPDLEGALAIAELRQHTLQAVEREIAEHTARKAEVRTAAILRIMQAPAPSGKPHSWSSAEALRETDPEYAAWKARDHELAQRRGQAETDLWAARLRAEYLGRTLPPMALEFTDSCDDEGFGR